ncbi:MAG: D-alanine--D-alanine ligase [Bacteroidota bacterium]
MKKNIAIIMGGYSSEYDISIKSGSVVQTHLSKEKFNLYTVIITSESWHYKTDKGEKIEINKHDFSLGLSNGKVTFDCIFNAIHGTPGEDGLLQAYFELLGIPQTSCGAYQAGLTFNKRDLLSTLKPYGIKCATSYYLNKGEPINSNAIIEKVGLPCFVKANRAGSSFGISKVYKIEDFQSALQNAFKEDEEVIIESFLNGIEISVGVITFGGKTKVLPMTEIVSENDFFDYSAKYEGKSQEITPARISKLQHSNAVSTARNIYELLKMKGYSRSEFIFQGDVPYLLEVNTTPGLTEESILPQQAQAAGISLSELFESAIDEALK